MDTELMSIGELSKLLGVSQNAIKNWEERGLISPVKTPGGHRRYDYELVKYIAKGFDYDEDNLTDVQSQLLSNCRQAIRIFVDEFTSSFSSQDGVVVIDWKRAAKSLVTILNGIDTASSLAASMSGLTIKGNKKKYTSFLRRYLLDHRKDVLVKDGKSLEFDLAEIIYEIRCIMIHESDNLNPGHLNRCIALNWEVSPHPRTWFLIAEYTPDNKMIFSGYEMLCICLELLVKFVDKFDWANQLKNCEAGRTNKLSMRLSLSYMDLLEKCGLVTFVAVPDDQVKKLMENNRLFS